jgi:AraC-like DNA-binding protein
VVLTLALGIGANSAIFTLVRGVLLKPLVNSDEDRLIYIRQSAPGVGDDNTTFSVPEIEDKLRRVIDYIRENLDADLKIAEIAQQVNMSASHFTRQFKLATDLAPHQYIMQKRIEAAKKLLSETEIPIAQIALEIGFQSQSRFTTLFGQLTGTTPRVYRAKNAFFALSDRIFNGTRLPAAA